MQTRLLITSIALAAATVISVAPASAQRWEDRGYPVQQDCRQRVNDGRLTGAAIGAGVGALAGGNIAARGNRTEGAVLGALLGAAIGQEVGARRLACDDPAYNQGRGAYVPGGYGAQPAYGYGQGGYGNGYGSDQQYQVSYAPPRGYGRGRGHDACGWGQAVLTRPDGYSERRDVWMCQNRRGEWSVQDR
jgi:hypothetical protein